MKVNVFSAEALNDKQKNKLSEILKNLFADKNLEFTVTYSPDLISGLKVQYGSKIIDLSLAGKIDMLRNYLING